VLALAAVVLPPLRGHLRRGQGGAVSLPAVLADVNHLGAFGLMAALVLSSFILWPYLPIYLEYNVGLPQERLKFIYLCGGLATLGTLTLFGRLADRFGKRLLFYLLALVTLVPVVLVTNLPAGLPLLAVLGVTTALMVASSGRMVPAMALITGASAPRYRGSFLSVNAAVQHLTAGLAAWVGGLCLVQGQGQGPDGRDGPLDGFGLLGLVACAATVAGLVLAGRLRQAPGGDLAPDSGAVKGGDVPARDGRTHPVTPEAYATTDPTRAEAGRL
jgi:predicted MFS family arabinose efflux permease